MYFTHIHQTNHRNTNNISQNFKKWYLLLLGILKAVNSLYNMLINLIMLSLAGIKSPSKSNTSLSTPMLITIKPLLQHYERKILQSKYYLEYQSVVAKSLLFKQLELLKEDSKGQSL